MVLSPEFMYGKITHHFVTSACGPHAGRHGPASDGDRNSDSIRLDDNYDGVSVSVINVTDSVTPLASGSVRESFYH